MDMETYVPSNSSFYDETSQTCEAEFELDFWGLLGVETLPNEHLELPERSIVGETRRSASSRTSLEATKERRKKAEFDAAMRSMACQLAVQPDTSTWLLSNVDEDSDEFKRAVSFSIPMQRHVEERISMVLSRCDIVSRMPAFEDGALGGGVGVRRLSSFIEYACSTFRGRAIASSVLESTTPRDRFSNSWILVGADTWVDPSPIGTKHRYARFHLENNAFGERFDIESDIRAMERHFQYGYSDSQQITDELLRTGALGPSKRVDSDEDALEKLRLYFEDQNPLLTVFHGQNVSRQLILRRFGHLSEGKKYNRRIQNSLNRFRTKRGLLTPGVFAEVFNTVDLFRFVVDRLSPCDMVQLLKTTKWENEIGKLIRHRMPSLCIYELPGIFPHMEDGNGNAIMHKEKQMKIAVGIRYERRRIDSSESSEIHTFDAAYTCEGAKNCQSTTTFDLKTQEDTEIVTIPYHVYFVKPPILQFELIDVRTGMPPNVECRFGGMTPSVAIQKVYAKKQEIRLFCNIDYQQLRTLSSGNLAVLAQFGLKNVALKTTPFQISATATGIEKGTTDKPLVLKTHSLPFYIRSSKSNAQRAPAAKRLRTSL